MLKEVFQPKTSALQNLQEMFEEFPVVTNESLKLKMETIGKKEIDGEDLIDGISGKQHLFGQLLTSINPFAQFIVREMIEGNDEAGQDKFWELD